MSRHDIPGPASRNAAHNLKTQQKRNIGIIYINKCKGAPLSTGGSILFSTGLCGFSQKARQRMTLTKLELVHAVVSNLGITQREGREMVEAFFSEIMTSLEAGEEVKLSGFGIFSLRDKTARPGRNPQSGEEVEITARRVVVFHPSGKLRDAAQTGAAQERMKAGKSWP